MYNEKYIAEIKNFTSTINLDFLENQTICVTGGTGLIGSYLIDSILFSNKNVKIVLLCTNKTRAKERFNHFSEDDRLIIKEQDLLKPIDVTDSVNYIISAASFTDPKNYKLYPVETLTTNVMGNHNMLEFAKKQVHLKKFFLCSSCEIYGEETDILKETTKGIVNCLDVRSCYNESKRVCETMAVSYYHEYQIPTVIGRLSRTYGPTMKLSDTKALSQFMFKSLNHEDVVLKSKGDQQFSYCYVSDCVSGILTLLEKGENAEAYNITNDTETLMLREIAKIVADFSDVQLKFELPTEQEANAYSRATIAIQDASKLKALGWKPQVSLKDGLAKTMSIIKIRKR